MSNPKPTPYAEVQDFAFEITAEAINTLEGRLRSSGCEHPQVVADLAMAALAVRLSPEEAVRLAASEDASAAMEAFTSPTTLEELNRREKREAEGQLVRFPQAKK
jgi:hypothetical protein